MNLSTMVTGRLAFATTIHLEANKNFAEAQLLAWNKSEKTHQYNAKGNSRCLFVEGGSPHINQIMMYNDHATRNNIQHSRGNIQGSRVFSPHG